MSDKLTASEAVYGILGWLSTRDERVSISSVDDVAILAELADEFCKANGLKEPRYGWENNLIHPSGECR